LRITGFVCSTLLLCLLAVTDAGAKPRQSSGRGHAAESSSAKKTPGKQASSKKRPAKAGDAQKSSSQKVASSSKKDKQFASPTVARAPRQATPTPERYMEIQQALISRGLHSGPADGVWSSDWVAALKQFQEQQNLNPDGKLGALSLIALGFGPKQEPMAQFAGKPESGQ
jgi:peptidoglycan hydrolase-like protein with peptidoglycan-binding domain